MRRVLFTTYGSYGDLHPFIAMAKVLKARGDQVTIVTHTHYRENVERQGIRFIGTRPELADASTKEGWEAEANHPRRGAEFIVREVLMPYLEQSYEAVAREAESADLLIGHILSFAVPLAAEKLGKPWLSTTLAPGALFSAYDPPILAPLPFLQKLEWLGPGFFRWLGPFAVWMTNPLFRPLQDFRARLGLGPGPNPLLQGASPYGNLVLFPEEFARPQVDWPARSRQLPFPFFDQEEREGLTPATESFLRKGSPPFVFTLGTAIVKMHSNYWNEAFGATKALGARAIFLVGKEPKSVPEAAFTDPNILVVDYEPFSALFPRAQAVIHQCGIGTTAQALRAGRPQVLVPFAHDQPDNARRVERLGLGMTVPAQKLTAARLATALRQVESDLVPARDFAAKLAGQNFAEEFPRALVSFLN